MQSLKTIVWVVLAVIIVIFSMANWVPVTATVWPGYVLETRLPVLVISAFLAGSLPLWILYRTTHWRMKRRAESAERSLADLRAANAAAAAHAAPPATVTPAPLSPPAESGLL